MDGTERPSEAVVSLVANRENVDVQEMTPLYDAIDPDALDSLFRDGAGNVKFEYEGYLVTVDHENGVDVSTPDDND